MLIKIIGLSLTIKRGDEQWKWVTDDKKKKEEAAQKQGNRKISTGKEVKGTDWEGNSEPEMGQEPPNP